MQKIKSDIATKRHVKKKTVKPSNRHEENNRLGIIDVRLSFIEGAMASLW